MEASVRELIDRLEEPGVEARLAALDELGRQLPVEALDAVSDLFDDPSPDVRYLARKVAARIARFNRVASRSVQPQRLQQFEHEAERLRQSQVAPELAADSLWATFVAMERWEKISAIYRTATRGHPALSILLQRTLTRDRDPHVLATAAKTIGMVAGEAALPQLLPFLHHEDPRVRANAVEGLEATGSRQVVDSLLVATQDPDHRVKANALGAFARFDREFAYEALARMVAAEQPRHRDAGLECLVRLGDQRAATLIRGCLSDPVEEIRRKAEKALVRFADAVLMQMIPAETDAGLRTRLEEILARRTSEQAIEAETSAQRGIGAASHEERERIVDLLRGGQLAEARYRAEFLLTRQPDNSELKALLADILEASGEIATALRYLEELQVEAPSNPVLQARIGRLRGAQGDSHLWWALGTVTGAFVAVQIAFRPGAEGLFAGLFAAAITLWLLARWQCELRRRLWMSLIAALLVPTLVAVGAAIRAQWLVAGLLGEARRLIDRGVPREALGLLESAAAVAPEHAGVRRLERQCRFLVDREALRGMIDDPWANLAQIDAHLRALALRYGQEPWYEAETFEIFADWRLLQARVLIEDGRTDDGAQLLASMPGRLSPLQHQRWLALIGRAGRLPPTTASAAPPLVTSPIDPVAVPVAPPTASAPGVASVSGAPLEHSSGPGSVKATGS